jgi:hypothetical protein
MADQAPAATAGGRSRTKFNPTENAVQRTRAWTGLLVVVLGDVFIAAAAIVGVFLTGKDTGQIVAILTSAFTAIGTMTAAYFGIRAATNTAQSAVVRQPGVGAAPAAAPAAPADGGPGAPGGGPGDGGPGEPAAGGPGQPAAAAAAEPADAGIQEDGGTGEVGTESDRPEDEPEDATQEDQAQLMRETGNHRGDISEEEEARLLKAEFGPADQNGVYGAPKEKEEG